MQSQILIPHLFRTEFSKIVSVLCAHFGLSHIESAEDITSETFMAALETWPYKGVPENPTAWLYTVAKNKTKNLLARDKLFQQKISRNISAGLEEAAADDKDIDLSETNIADSQLQMLFAVCHPIIPPEAQVGLALRVLCGFGIGEIATAFLSSTETINKRLQRAKEKLRSSTVAMQLPQADEIPARLQGVLLTLYLLFSEGYYSGNSDHLIREELCFEAMRLNRLLLDSKQANTPQSNALMALMCFHASRFAARQDQNGEIILYDDQDEDLWNQDLVAKGCWYFKQSASGDGLSRYHLEAGIAYWNTIKTDNGEKWENILMLYNHLLRIAYSPAAALNRTFALAKARGSNVALPEALMLKLDDFVAYHLLLGELYLDSSLPTAVKFFEQAKLLSKSRQEQQRIGKKIDSIRNMNMKLPEV